MGFRYSGKLLSHRKLTAYIYTDRPIYRPGDTVYFRLRRPAGHQRTLHPAGYQLLPVDTQ